MLENFNFIWKALKFINTEKRLERVMESKIKSDSVIIHETLSIVKQQAGGSQGEESLMGMQLGGGKSGIMGSVIFILLVIIFHLDFLFCIGSI